MTLVEFFGKIKRDKEEKEKILDTFFNDYEEEMARQKYEFLQEEYLREGLVRGYMDWDI